MKKSVPLFAAVMVMALAQGPMYASADGVTAKVTDPVTLKECSSCHMAFPPQFLPQRSWQALMGDLGNHFGEDASLPADTQAAITTYLVAHAADSNGSGKRLLRGVKDTDTPLRITVLPWWKREHGEISAARFTSDNVKTAANCVACHRGAVDGYFEDD